MNTDFIQICGIYVYGVITWLGVLELVHDGVQVRGVRVLQFEAELGGVISVGLVLVEMDTIFTGLVLFY
jgi:hypothetical protein